MFLKAIKKEENLKYFIGFFILDFSIGLLTSSVATYFDPNATKNPIEDEAVLVVFIVSILIGPIIETLLSQILIIEVLLRAKVKPILCIGVSALVFGISHNYNVFYIIAMVISGFIYALYYYKLRDQGKLNGLLLVFVLHSLNNLLAFFTFISKAY